MTTKLTRTNKLEEIQKELNEHETNFWADWNPWGDLPQVMKDEPTEDVNNLLGLFSLLDEIGKPEVTPDGDYSNRNAAERLFNQQQKQIVIKGILEILGEKSNGL